jgi:hypothetical protein
LLINLFELSLCEVTSTNSHILIPIQTIETEKCILTWMEGNIFEITVKEKAYMELDDVKEIQIHKAQLIKNQQHGILFISPEFGNLSKEAREYSASLEASINCVAKAVIAPNLGMKIMANFYITFNKPVVQHKIFTQKNEAIIWLMKRISNQP